MSYVVHVMNETSRYQFDVIYRRSDIESVRLLWAIANSIGLLYKKQSSPRVTKVLPSFLSSITEWRRMKLKTGIIRKKIPGVQWHVFKKNLIYSFPKMWAIFVHFFILHVILTNEPSILIYHLSNSLFRRTNLWYCFIIFINS